jgi:hypothetical protein
LDKVKEAVRLSLEDDDRHNTKEYDALIAERAKLKSTPPSESTQDDLNRLNKRIKYFEPQNSFKTNRKLDKLQQVKKEARKLKKRSNVNKENFLTLCRRGVKRSSSPPPPPAPPTEEAAAEAAAEAAVEAAEAEKKAYELELWGVPPKKKKVVLLPEDE